MRNSLLVLVVSHLTAWWDPTKFELQAMQFSRNCGGVQAIGDGINIHVIGKRPRWRVHRPNVQTFDRLLIDFRVCQINLDVIGFSTQ